MALTACQSTNAPSATPIKTIEITQTPQVANELLIQHQRPEPPSDGSPEQLLNHAVSYGTYCQKLEMQVQGWQEWYEQRKPNE